MNGIEALERICSEKIIAVLRGESTVKVLKAVDAIVDGGVSVVEITFTNEDPCKLIECNAEKSDRLVGAGTVLSLENAVDAVSAGAQFIVSPCTIPEVINYCLEKDVLVMPGVYTPTEVYKAMSMGVQVLKLFPGSSGGIGHLKALRGPFPKANFVPTGGVDKSNINNWFAAGARAVGLGSNLAPINMINEENYIGISTLVQNVVTALER